MNRYQQSDPPSLNVAQSVVGSLGHTGLYYGLAVLWLYLGADASLWVNTAGLVAAAVGIPCQQGGALL